MPSSCTAPSVLLQSNPPAPAALYTCQSGVYTQIVTQGPTGPAGVAGPTGPTGPPGTGCGAGAGAACVIATPSSNQIVNAAAGVTTGTNTLNTGQGVNYTNTVSGLLNYSLYPNATNEAQLWEQDTFGPGSNTGFPGTGGGLNSTDTGITVNHHVRLVDNFHRMGISQGLVMQENSHHGGDSFGFYLYGNSRNGWDHPADEGHSDLKINGSGATTYPVGTVLATTGTGDLAPSLSMNDLAEETFLIDTAKPVATGTITAYTSGTYAGASNGSLYLQPVSSTLTPSNICVTTAPIHLQMPYGTPSTSTVGCTTSQGTMGSGVAWVVTINPLSAEQCGIASASGNVTLTCLRSHATGTYVFQGGTKGFFSPDPEATKGWKMVEYAFGSADSSHLITGLPYGGAWGQPFPIFGYSISGVGSTFHLFPGAEIVNVGDKYGTLMSLGANDVPWATGDTVENPNKLSQLDQTVIFASSPRTPALPGSGAGSVLITAGYEGVNAAWHMLQIQNFGNPGYFGMGGTVTAPPGTQLLGAFSNEFVTDMPLGGQVGDNCGSTPAWACVRGSSYTGQVSLWQQQDRSQRFYFDRAANSWNFSGLVNEPAIAVQDIYPSGGNITTHADGGFIGSDNNPSLFIDSTNPAAQRTSFDMRHNGISIWQWGVDSAYNGTKDLYLYNYATGHNTLIVHPDDSVTLANSINATAYQVGGVAGFTGKCTSPQTPTFANGIVTGCS